MRLLNTRSYQRGVRLEIVEKWGNDIPQYAIFSHTWSDSEVLIADILNGTFNGRAGFFKLESALLQAKSDGWDWLWADNCCIDKTNSVELSEAINSMFKYYKDSEICYAYLADVSTTAWEDEIRKARWWKRGWTLQELIAPSSLQLFSRTWDSLGTRNDLREMIKGITGIEDEYLIGYPIEHASIAKRMAWAASRETTRDEDIAYCLIGIFDVNMPMLYGEGAQRAFVRLKEEIMRNSEDHSLFAWTKSQDDNVQHGLLADCPKDFQRTAFTTAYKGNADYSPPIMTAKGLRISLPLIQKADGTFVAALLCHGVGYDSRLAVYLTKLPTGDNQYARVKCRDMASIAWVGQPREIYIRQRFISIDARFDRPHGFQIQGLHCSAADPGLAGYRIIEQQSLYSDISSTLSLRRPTPWRRDWSSVPLVYRIQKSPRVLAVALLIRRTLDSEGFVLMLGAHSDFSVGFCVEEIGNQEFLPHYDDLQKSFIPQPPATHMALGLHTVLVNVQERVEKSAHTPLKIYHIDIEVQARPRPPREDALDDAVVAGDNRAMKAGFRDRIKRYWA